MSRRIVLATRNDHKVVEMSRILADAGCDVELVGLSKFPEAPEPAETGTTFSENALIKARSAALATGLPALADDSGICVDALHGMPGVLSARWSGRHGDDVANVMLLLGQLSDVPDYRRGAEFVCAIAFVEDDREHIVEAGMTGTLTREVRGSGGFGYDPVFVADGQSVTNAELTPEQKDAISHRGKAIRQIAPFLG
jgi:XTP/dITP diphosphohydrolase